MTQNLSATAQKHSKKQVGNSTTLRIVTLGTTPADYVINVDENPEFESLFAEIKDTDIWKDNDKVKASDELYDAVAQMLKAIQAKKNSTVDALMSPGGTGFNVLACIKAFLQEKAVCTAITYLGIVTDERPKTNGEIILNRAAELGINIQQPPNLSDEQKSSLRTPVAYAFIYKGKKYILQNNGKGADFYTPTNVRPLIKGEENQNNNAAFLPCASIPRFGFDVFMAAIDEAKQNGMRIYTSLPTSDIPQEQKNEIKKLITNGTIDFVFCNIDELRMFLNEKYEGGEKYPSYLSEIASLKEALKKERNSEKLERLELLERELETQNRNALQEFIDLLPRRTQKLELPAAWITNGAEEALLIKCGQQTLVKPRQYEPADFKIVNPTGAGDSTFGFQIVADFFNLSLKKTVSGACQVSVGKMGLREAQVPPTGKSWTSNIAWENTRARLDYQAR